MSLLFLTCLFPLIGFLILAFSAGRMNENQSALVGVGSIGLAALSALWVGIEFHAAGAETIFNQTLWQWIKTADLNVGMVLHLDGLSLTMLGVVSGVGFLIHLFASWYMRGEEGYSRFFTYTNLFIASMLILVLADNLLWVFRWEANGFVSAVFERFPSNPSSYNFV